MFQFVDYLSALPVLLGLALVGFIVWAHHMFTSGMSEFANMLFSALTFLVAIPSGVKVFNWTATLYKGSISFAPPMLYALAFLFLFTIGGLTGLFLGTLNTDIHLHDTYFVVAHFHYVLSLGAVFAIFCGFYYWFTKMTGREYPEWAGKFHFWTTFVGVNLTFFPQHFLGLQGMPRRYPDYPDAFAGWNLVSSLGSYIAFASTIFFVVYTIKVLRSGKLVTEADPYHQPEPTLEWTVASPAPFHTFEELPRVTAGAKH